jgi:hypothetical protein
VLLLVGASARARRSGWSASISRQQRSGHRVVVRRGRRHARPAGAAKRDDTTHILKFIDDDTGRRVRVLDFQFSFAR